MNGTPTPQYLDALGIRRWVRRQPVAVTAVVEEMASDESLGFTSSAQPTSFVGWAEVRSPTVSAAPPVVIAEPMPVQQPVVITARNAEQDARDWARLQAEVRQCTACELHKQRTQTVFGVGNQQAELMVIGEAPGAEEDRQGEPFVGAAGKLLNAMLAAITLKRQAVYIANIVKCRPPNNRDPRPEEMAACHGYLQRQIALVQPRVILAVGRIAAQALLESADTVGALRNKVHRYGSTQIPLIVTYHPAYLLRTPIDKRKAWQDLQRVQTLLVETRAGISA